jgi:hypothetical protein
MIDTLRQWWLHLLSHPGQAAAWTYLFVGFAVVVYVCLRYGWWRNRPGPGPAWRSSETPHRYLSFLLDAGGLHPVSLLIQVALWPFWILFLWAYAPEVEDDEGI